METITAGTVRPCCASGAAMRVLEDSDRLTTRQCVAPAEDGLAEVDGVRVCGRRHFRAKFLGLDARSQTGRLGG